MIFDQLGNSPKAISAIEKRSVRAYIYWAIGIFSFNKQGQVEFNWGRTSIIPMDGLGRMV